VAAEEMNIRIVGITREQARAAAKQILRETRKKKEANLSFRERGTSAARITSPGVSVKLCRICARRSSSGHATTP
jgi:hypothetical protein